jgi:hypothetical protein
VGEGDRRGGSGRLRALSVNGSHRANQVIILSARRLQCVHCHVGRVNKAQQVPANQTAHRSVGSRPAVSTALTAPRPGSSPEYAPKSSFQAMANVAMLALVRQVNTRFQLHPAHATAVDDKHPAKQCDTGRWMPTARPPPLQWRKPFAWQRFMHRNTRTMHHWRRGKRIRTEAGELEDASQKPTHVAR